jgi:Integrase core domain
MRFHGLQNKRLRRPKWRGGHAAGDLANLSQFEPTAPDQLWLTDITFVRLRSRWIYLAVLLDAFSRRCIAWALGTRITTELTLEALRMALVYRRPKVRSSTIPIAEVSTEVRTIKTHCLKTGLRRASAGRGHLPTIRCANASSERSNAKKSGFAHTSTSTTRITRLVHSFTTTTNTDHTARSESGLRLSSRECIIRPLKAKPRKPNPVFHKWGALQFILSLTSLLIWNERCHPALRGNRLRARKSTGNGAFR